MLEYQKSAITPSGCRADIAVCFQKLLKYQQTNGRMYFGLTHQGV